MDSILSLLKAENINPYNRKACYESLSETVMPSANIRKYKDWLVGQGDEVFTVWVGVLDANKEQWGAINKLEFGGFLKIRPSTYLKKVGYHGFNTAKMKEDERKFSAILAELSLL